MSKWNKIRQMYYIAFSDKTQINNVLGVISDVYQGTFPDDSPMGMYTVGELKQVQGFHGSLPMIHELCAAMQGRSVRGLMIEIGMSPFDPLITKLFEETDLQQERIVPIIFKKAEEKFGKPTFIDEAKIADLTSRAMRFLNKTH